MNKHHGSRFDDYLKEKGTFEEVSALTQKRWEELQTQKPSDTAENPETGWNQRNLFTIERRQGELR